MKFLCKDGTQQLCSRQVLGFSDFLYFKARKMGSNVEDKIQFDYTKYSHEAVKFFLDSLHMIDPPPTDIAIVLEVIDLAHSEGQTVMYDSFERKLSKRLMSALLESTFSTGIELLIAELLSKVDNLHEEYEQKVGKDLTRDFCSDLFYDFDLSSDPNKQLIEMCLSKGVFDDCSRKSVLYTLTEYGQGLQRLYKIPSSFE